MKYLIGITLLLVSTLASANQCKDVDEFFNNAILVKHCMGAIFNTPNANNHGKVFRTHPNCTNASKKIDPNRAKLRNMDINLRNACMKRYGYRDRQTISKIYTVYNQLQKL